MNYRWLLLALAAFAVACSRRSERTNASDAPAALPESPPLAGMPDSMVNGFDIVRYRAADSAKTPSVSLAAVSVLPLGRTPEDQPRDLRDVAISGDTVYVLDGGGPSVLAFLRTGRLLWRAGDDSGADLGLADPQHLTRYRDSLYVSDVGKNGHVAVLTTSGHLARQIRIAVDRGIWSTAVTGSRLYVSLVDPEDGDSSMSMVLAADRNGRVLGRGCRRHPTIAFSIAHGGLLNVARLTNVWTDGSAAYCQQMISPVVQVLESTGTLTGVENRAPPFYRPPQDEPGTTNDRTILANSAKWFPHIRFFPTRGGFVSVYAAYDSVTEVSSYRLFACDGTGEAPRCYTVSTLDRPLELIAPDTIVALRPPGAAADTPALELLVPRRVP